MSEKNRIKRAIITIEGDGELALYRKDVKEKGTRICGYDLIEKCARAAVSNNIATRKSDIYMAIFVEGVSIAFDYSKTDELHVLATKLKVPVTIGINYYGRWRAQFKIRYADNMYSHEQIANIVELVGCEFGLGRGATRGYGRYNVTNVEAA